MKTEKLVRMANQIAGFFSHEGPERGAASTADHLKKFWDPRMRRQLLEHLNSQAGADLHPIVRQTILSYRQDLSGIVETATTHPADS